MKQEQQKQLEQEVSDLTNCWFAERAGSEKASTQLDEFRQMCTLQAEFIGEHHQSHEFIEWLQAKKNHPSQSND